MKKTILTALAMTVAVGAFAQGTVAFNNRTASSVSHIWASPSSVHTQIRGNTAADNPPGATDYGPALLIGTSGGLAASATFASILGANGNGVDETNLVAASAGGVTTFRTGANSGYISPTTATFNNIPVDAPAGTFEVVAWDNSSGQYATWALASVAWKAGLIAAGTSGTFNVAAVGGTFNTPPNLTALTSFNIYSIPEPTTIALAGLGAAALVIFRRRKQ